MDETSKILKNKSLMKAIRQGEKDIANKKYITFDSLKKLLHFDTPK